MELARCTLDSVRVLEVRWDKEDTVGVEGYTFLYGDGNKNHQLGIEFLHRRIESTFKTGEFASNRMSHIMLRGCWCDIIFMNVHAPRVEKSGDSNDKFYEEFERL